MTCLARLAIVASVVAWYFIWQQALYVALSSELHDLPNRLTIDSDIWWIAWLAAVPLTVLSCLLVVLVGLAVNWIIEG